MRHRKAGRRLGRNTPHRKAMMRNMVTSFFEHERIQTTETRAKELRILAEKLVTMGKKGLPGSFPEGTDEKAMQAHKLHKFRQVLRVVRDTDIAHKVMNKLAPRFEDRPGGYTRMIKMGRRLGDNAPMTIIEFVDYDESPDKGYVTLEDYNED